MKAGAAPGGFLMGVVFSGGLALYGRRRAFAEMSLPKFVACGALAGFLMPADSVQVANNLAWLYATHPRAEFRNAAEALTLATRICELTNYEAPAYLDTLAAAQAEAGRFSEAIDSITKAIRLANGTGQHALATKLKNRIHLYRSNKPFRE